MKLPKKLTALLACLAMLVVGLTGMVPERAAASTPLDLRVIGDNLGEPDEPDGHRNIMSTQMPIVDLLVRVIALQSTKPATVRSRGKSSAPSSRAQKFAK